MPSLPLLATSPIAPNSRRIDRYKPLIVAWNASVVKCVLRLFACGFCGFARVMWSGISFLLDAWFLRLLGEGQFRILPLRGRPKKQGLYAKSSSSQSSRISSVASHFASWFCIAFRIMTLHCLNSFTCKSNSNCIVFQSCKNRGYRTSLSCFMGSNRMPF